MLKKNKTVLILTLILFLLAVVLAGNKRYLSTLQHKDADFAVMDTASVTKIFIADLDTNQVLLERHPEGWTVNTYYRANQQKVDIMLNTMMKLRVRGPVSRSSHDNVVKRMAGIAVKVEVYQIQPRINLFGRIKLFPHEKRTKVYYVGDNPRDNIGTFMYKEGAQHAYIMHLTGFVGFVMTRYSPLEDEWRDYTIFRKKMNEIQSVTIEFGEEPEQSYRIDRLDRHQFQITRLNDQTIMPEFDTLKLLNYLTAFSDIRFEALMNYLPVRHRDSITHMPFLHRIALNDIHGESVGITTFKKHHSTDHLEIEEQLIPVDHDRMYALVNEDRDFVLVQYFVFDKIVRPLSYFEPGIDGELSLW
ncbi:MAG: DUF4340 domain-containing protein [Bacteroidales bacterium]|nr:DUF4340 domain-containing protein [Bacteroidales bacterium]